MSDTQSSQFASIGGKQAGASMCQEERSNCKSSSKITSTKESKQEQEKHKVEKGQNQQKKKKKRRKGRKARLKRAKVGHGRFTPFLLSSIRRSVGC